jgi:hypothetical protein
MTGVFDVCGFWSGVRAKKEGFLASKTSLENDVLLMFGFCGHGAQQCCAPTLFGAHSLVLAWFWRGGQPGMAVPRGD